MLINFDEAVSSTKKPKIKYTRSKCSIWAEILRIAAKYKKSGGSNDDGRDGNFCTFK